LFSGGGSFQFRFWVSIFGKQVFKFSAFSLAVISSLALFRVHFIVSLKSASRFSNCVSVCGGFDWLCFMASALFSVRFARFSKSACLFFAKILAKIQVALFQQASWFA
jgi:hypothetical protein